MSNVYVTSDWHLGHNGISNKFRTGFDSDHHHDHHIVEMARSYLTKRDTLICVGDMSFTVEGMEMIDSLPGTKILVRGNHDILQEDQYHAVFDAVQGAWSYKGVWITHMPVHPMELYGRPNIHGHCHRGGPYEHQQGEHWDMYYNAILEYNDYKLVNLMTVKEMMAARRELY